LFLHFSAISAIFGAVTTQADEVRLRGGEVCFPWERRLPAGPSFAAQKSRQDAGAPRKSRPLRRACGRGKLYALRCRTRTPDTHSGQPTPVRHVRHAGRHAAPISRRQTAQTLRYGTLMLHIRTLCRLSSFRRRKPWGFATQSALLCVRPLQRCANGKLAPVGPMHADPCNLVLLAQVHRRAGNLRAVAAEPTRGRGPAQLNSCSADGRCLPFGFLTTM
jgi:hypothetical protein